MLTITIALILIISAICIPLIFILFNKKNSNERNKILLDLVSREGSKHGLSFSGKIILKDKIIAFDGFKQTLMVYKFEHMDDVICINMADVRNCTVNREYDRINMGDEKRVKIEQHLRCIDLKFDFKSGAVPVSISFYDSKVNSIYEMAELEAKAKDWKIILSKMILKQLKVSA